MDNNHIAPKEAENNNGSARISGTPSIAELKKRIEMKQQKKGKTATRKKTS